MFHHVTKYSTVGAKCATLSITMQRYLHKRTHTRQPAHCCCASSYKLYEANYAPQLSPHVRRPFLLFLTKRLAHAAHNDPDVCMSTQAAYRIACVRR